MATTSMASSAVERRSSQLGVGRVTVATGLTAAAVFVLCWIGIFIPFASPTHAYVGLFTAAEPKSIFALCEGTFWSLLFGALVGGLFGLIYNATASMDRR